MVNTLPIGPTIEVRCTKCSKLLGKKYLSSKGLELKCVRCGTLNSVFEKMQEQVIVTDPNGIILYTNKAVEDITGYTAKEIIGSTPALWGKQMPDQFYKKMWMVIKKKKQSIKMVVKNKRKDGTIYHALLLISPVLDTTKRIRFYVGIETIINNKKST